MITEKVPRGQFTWVLQNYISLSCEVLNYKLYTHMQEAINISTTTAFEMDCVASSATSEY